MSLPILRFGQFCGNPYTPLRSKFFVGSTKWIQGHQKSKITKNQIISDPHWVLFLLPQNRPIHFIVNAARLHFLPHCSNLTPMLCFAFFLLNRYYQFAYFDEFREPDMTLLGFTRKDFFTNHYQ